MCLLFISSIFPHYYAWWMYFNYYNDDYFAQWWHQTFFEVTELISTGMALHLVSRKSAVTGKKIIFIMRY